VDVSELVNVIEKKIEVCLETIENIGATEIPLITVLNKIDLPSSKEIKQNKDELTEKGMNPVTVSALYETNLDILKQEITKRLTNHVRASIMLLQSDESMSFLSWLSKRADLQKITYMGKSINIIFESTPSFAEKIKYRVEKLDGKMEKLVGVKRK
jgi:50S ribosomal subunit-associated GTPase HflX